MTMFSECARIALSDETQPVDAEIDLLQVQVGTNYACPTLVPGGHAPPPGGDAVTTYSKPNRHSSTLTAGMRGA